MANTNWLDDYVKRLTGGTTPEFHPSAKTITKVANAAVSLLPRQSSPSPEPAPTNNESVILSAVKKFPQWWRENMFEVVEPTPGKSMSELYKVGGGGAKGVGYVVGDTLREAFNAGMDQTQLTEAGNKTYSQSAPGQFLEGVWSGATGDTGTPLASKAAATPTESKAAATSTAPPVRKFYEPVITPVGVDRERVSYGNGAVTGIRRAVPGVGGFAGASTDAEAARNLDARVAQDDAASSIAQSLNRAASAQRDLRAERLGVSRGVLDQLEGRAGYGADTGVSFGGPSSDGRGVEAKLDDAIRDAAIKSAIDRGQTAFGRANRAAALDAAGKLIAQKQAEAENQTALARAAGEMQQAGLAAQARLGEAQLRDSGDMRRAALNAQTQLAVAKLGQAGRQEAAQAQAAAKREERAAKSMDDSLKFVYDLASNDKIPATEIATFMSDGTLAQMLNANEYTPQEIARVLTAPTKADAAKTLEMYKAWKAREQSAWYAPWRTDETPADVVKRHYPQR